ncbi:hypothetical protein CPU12_01820 [Malaciobacter molluscorum LMG 25693]|uniref:Amidoligase n=1 Tax=Malaciobacter molluscorum LMG 25693 TaxID=870501 RepID=A0A2G1DKI4_9BACT|nr:amidoligase family protein [Malaciobacter molluscorum]AXX92584.1 amidoligase [Malaciobacter molluscorum LMG 25693]PHO19008.1 hypothetical protein CPU12_01820 [Malaciobacter molluscorum LMG 25693]
MNSFKMPKVTQNYEGNIRKVGFEIEFSNMRIKKIVSLLKKTYNLKETKVNNFLYTFDSEFGDFIAELDFELLTKQKLKSNVVDFFNKMGMKIDGTRIEKVEDIIGSISKDLVPYEISTPPIPLDKISMIDKLSDNLYKLGAHGTKKKVYNAFGLHINIEVSSLDVQSLLNYLRAYVILETFLVKDAKIDIARKITPYIDKFKEDYINKILSESYEPTIDELIDDYIKYNPTRNRSLDMLPIFAFIDESKVRKSLKKEKINPRPAFHYRLSNSLVGEEDWKISDEWNRWLYVERVANDTKLLSKLSKKYLFHLEKFINFTTWEEKVSKCVKNQ